MFVAAMKMVLDFYGNDEVSVKRREIHAFALLFHRKFEDVSLVEVADFDDPERIVLGLSFVCAQQKRGEDRLLAIRDWIDAHSFARVTMEDRQVLPFW